MSQFPVIGNTPHPEIDTALRRIGMPLVDKTLYHLNDFGYLLGSPGIDISPGNIEGIHILKMAIGELARQLAGGNTKLIGSVDNLIVDVSNILDILHLIATKLEVTLDDIKNDITHGMADMRLVIGSNPTDIHLNLIAIGEELLLLAGKGVIYLQYLRPFSLYLSLYPYKRFSSSLTRLSSDASFSPTGSGNFSTVSVSGFLMATTRPGTPTTVALAGTDFMTTEPAPTLVLSPIVILPITCAPTPTTTLLPRVG